MQRKVLSLNKFSSTALFLAAVAAPALASGTHSGGHGDNAVIGEPGDKTKATQTVMLTMKETDDGKMVFMPAAVSVKQGQTVRFKIRNSGQSDHEFVLNTEPEILEHKKVMEKFPEMEHDDPNAIRLKAGQTGEIVWKFTNAGILTFACLIPGHYDAGMHGNVTIGQK